MHAMTGEEKKYLSLDMDGYVSRPVRIGLLRAEIDRLVGPPEQETREPIEEEGKKCPVH